MLGLVWRVIVVEGRIESEDSWEEKRCMIMGMISFKIGLDSPISEVLT